MEDKKEQESVSRKDAKLAKYFQTYGLARSEDILCVLYD